MISEKVSRQRFPDEKTFIIVGRHLSCHIAHHVFHRKKPLQTLAPRQSHRGWLACSYRRWHQNLRMGGKVDASEEKAGMTSDNAKLSGKVTRSRNDGACHYLLDKRCARPPGTTRSMQPSMA